MKTLTHSSEFMKKEEEKIPLAEEEERKKEEKRIYSDGSDCWSFRSACRGDFYGSALLPD